MPPMLLGVIFEFITPDVLAFRFLFNYLNNFDQPFSSDTPTSKVVFPAFKNPPVEQSFCHTKSVFALVHRQPLDHLSSCTIARTSSSCKSPFFFFLVKLIC